MYNYLSFTKGEPIATIRGGKHKRKVLYVTDQHKYADIPPAVLLSQNKSSVDKSGRELNLKRGTVKPMPNLHKRDIIYVSGPSGCGKSMWCAMYATQYSKLWPEHKIVLFSHVNADESIDIIPNLTRIDLSQICDMQVTNALLKDSLVIFDDCDTIRDDATRKEVQRIKDDLMQTGRHNNIYMLITSHILNNNKLTRIIMQEMNKLVIFPGTGSSYFTRYCLRNYVGMTVKEMDKALRLPSRWICIHTHAPRYVLYQTGAYML